MKEKPFSNYCEQIYCENHSQIKRTQTILKNISDLIENEKSPLYTSINDLIDTVYKEGFNDGISFIQWLDN